MNDSERLQYACNLLLQRIANLTADLVNAQVDAEALRREITELKKEKGENPLTAVKT